MTAVAQESEKQVARPLRVLVPLIKEDLEKGEEAAKLAGMPYYRAAGEKLLEAKAQLKHGEFGDWLKRNFNTSTRQLHYYMSLVEVENRARAPFSSLNEFRRKHLGERRPAGDGIVDRAKQEADRIRQESLTREQERDAQRKLALQLIDIGYKALATKLHPDKGGSRDAMSRLNQVRDRLKQHA